MRFHFGTVDEVVREVFAPTRRVAFGRVTPQRHAPRRRGYFACRRSGGSRSCATEWIQGTAPRHHPWELFLESFQASQVSHTEFQETVTILWKVITVSCTRRFQNSAFLAILCVKSRRFVTFWRLNRMEHSLFPISFRVLRSRFPCDTEGRGFSNRSFQKPHYRLA